MSRQRGSRRSQPPPRPAARQAPASCPCQRRPPPVRRSAAVAFFGPPRLGPRRRFALLAYLTLLVFVLTSLTMALARNRLDPAIGCSAASWRPPCLRWHHRPCFLRPERRGTHAARQKPADRWHVSAETANASPVPHVIWQRYPQATRRFMLPPPPWPSCRAKSRRWDEK